MTREEYKAWATVVVAHIDENEKMSEQFIKELEGQDKEAAALMRKAENTYRDLSKHLKDMLQKG